MEDDAEETPLPFTASEMDGGHAGRENTPRIRTRPRFQTSSSVHNTLTPIPRSLYGSQDVRRLSSTPSGSTADSQARLHDLIFFPGGDSGFGARGSPASEQTGGAKEQDEGKWREREEEMQIGRRLRVIGDHFQRERMQRFMRYRMEWEEICWHLATMLFIFLYPREFIGN